MLRQALSGAVRASRHALLRTTAGRVAGGARPADGLWGRGLPRKLATDASNTVWKTLQVAAATTGDDDDHLGLLARTQVLGWTYTELYKRVLGVALALRSLGMEQQDRVLVCTQGNDSEKLLVHLGASLAGVDVVSVSDPALLWGAQERLNCKALVISPQNFVFFEDIADLPQTFDHPPILTGPMQVPLNDSGRPPLVHSFVELITEVATAPIHELEEISHFLLDADSAEDHGQEPRVYFAGGYDASAGGNKLLPSMSQTELVAQGAAIMDLVSAGVHDRVLLGADLTTPFGTACAYGAVARSATIVLTNIESASVTAPRPDDVTMLSTLHDSKCTLLVTDEERFHNIQLPVPKVHDVSALRGGVVGGEAADSELSFVYAGIPFQHTTSPVPTASSSYF